MIASMGIGANSFHFVLELVQRTGESAKSLGSVAVPEKIGKHLDQGGGAATQIDWVDVSSVEPVHIGTATMPVVPALKGSISG